MYEKKKEIIPLEELSSAKAPSGSCVRQVNIKSPHS